jgi:beta-fructofuranosidase
LNGRAYLIGSIREDVKVHYWYADSPHGPYTNPHDNVLLPQGNYAARVCDEGDRCTLWNFYYVESKIKGTGNRLPPPKELITAADGQLKLGSFSGFDRVVVRTLSGHDIKPLRRFHESPTARGSRHDLSWWFASDSANELFLLEKPVRNFRLRGTFQMHGPGKCGLVLRMNEETDGYYISLDLTKGLVQARASGHNPHGGIEQAFIFEPLQANYFVSKGGTEPYEMQLIAYGTYIEFSLDGEVLLSFANDRYTAGYLGYYSEGAEVQVRNIVFEELEEPRGECYAIDRGNGHSDWSQA